MAYVEKSNLNETTHLVIVNTRLGSTLGGSLRVKESKKQARAQAKLAALLGMDAPDRRTTPLPRHAAETRSREAQATLEFVDKPHTFRRVECKVCERVFYVNRGQVSCCSDICAAKGLAEIGIEWDWSKPPESRWYVNHAGGKITNEPLIVPPEALDALRYLVTIHGEHF